MARRRKNKEADLVELVIKMIFGGILLLSLSIGGISGFAEIFGTLLKLLLWFLLAAVGVVLVGGLICFVIRRHREQPSPNREWAVMPAVRSDTACTGQPETTPCPVHPAWTASKVEYPPAPVQPEWTASKVEDALGEIDWYQFEKFCAALLRAEGYSVERKGGAQPDGGVDLVATKDAGAMLVQCKHWRTWSVQEKVIRELLGSMTHYQVKRGALYVLKGATRPATAFARQHEISISDGCDLATRAQNCLANSELTALLSSRTHHCPRCEAPMIWRTGNFTPFWGCSTYPRCRGTLKYSGAR